MTNDFLRLRAIATATALLALPGCVTAAGMAFESTLTDEELAELKSAGKTKSIDARFAQDFDREVKEMFASGYMLIGYSKFTSSLVPAFAERNARIAGRKQGATVAILAPPERAAMNQHKYTMTYWRPAIGQEHFFGAFYGDAAPQMIAFASCGRNLVTVDVVAKGSPAAEMGLQAGDGIMRFNDEPVPSAGRLDTLLLENANKPVSIWVLREDESLELVGALGAAPDDAFEVKTPKADIGLNATSAKLEGDVRKLAKRKTGFYVDGITYGRYACSSDLRSGDLLLSINGKSIKKASDVANAFKRRNQDTIEVAYVRAGEVRETSISFDDTTQNKVAGAQRRRILESDIAQPPWELAKGKDYTWMTLTGLVAQGAIQGYVNHLEAERARIDAYNRAQAAQPISNVTVTSANRRGGGYSATTTTGESFRINSDTAALLQANPSFNLYGTSRRGTRFEIRDQYGTKIDTPGSEFSPVFAAPGNLPDMSGMYDYYAGQQIKSIVLNQAFDNHMKQAGQLPTMFQTW
ncbi:MAG: PDZ domain-containing protein [Pseudomonadota bacterium]